MSRAAFEELAVRLQAATGHPAAVLVEGMQGIARTLRRHAVREPPPLDVAQILGVLVREGAEAGDSNVDGAVAALDGMLGESAGKVTEVRVVDGRVELTLGLGPRRGALGLASGIDTFGPKGALASLLAAPQRRRGSAGPRRS